ncbi:hypothetical protein COLO4_19660 [Corchorus olitorius]|uniref:Uncharacterized protein n=1 Tax=Corchorus olitorius TaxID=93759 RepID=A0A1R3J473_9ROSI|nr:hypothetical protein COLO4_19660 [Corchorus olitorius]
MGKGFVFDATASGAFVVQGSGPATPSSSTTFFNVSATSRSTSSQRPTTASVIITAPVSSPGEPQVQASAEPQAPTLNTEPTPPQTAPTQTAAKKSKPIKPSTQRPIPKILRMPAPSGRSWQDAYGKFHGLKRGRNSPTSVAKYKKSEAPTCLDMSCRTTSQPQGPLRRSPRNFQKNPTAGSSMEVNQSSSLFSAKRKADDVVTTQGSQSTANSKPVKGKKSCFHDLKY